MSTITVGGNIISSVLLCTPGQPQRSPLCAPARPGSSSTGLLPLSSPKPITGSDEAKAVLVQSLMSPDAALRGDSHTEAAAREQ